LAAGEEVVGIPHTLDRRKRLPGTGAVRARGRRRAGEHRVDRIRNELDVAELLRRDVRDEVVERPRALPVAKVEGLERVVQERGHLAELAAQELLNGCGSGRIRLGRRWQLGLDAIDATNHV
jgi:hypothetical protein